MDWLIFISQALGSFALVVAIGYLLSRALGWHPGGWIAVATGMGIIAYNIGEHASAPWLAQAGRALAWWLVLGIPAVLAYLMWQIAQGGRRLFQALPQRRGLSRLRQEAVDAADAEVPPWVAEHVRGHLIIGPLAGLFPFAWLYIIGGLAGMAALLYTGDAAEDAPLLLVIFAFIALTGLLYRPLPRFKQAVPAWYIVKTGGGIIVPFLIFYGLVELWNEPRPAPLAIIALAALWLPAWEFISRLRPYQRWITALRLLSFIAAAAFFIVL